MLSTTQRCHLFITLLIHSFDNQNYWKHVQRTGQDDDDDVVEDDYDDDDDDEEEDGDEKDNNEDKEEDDVDVEDDEESITFPPGFYDRSPGSDRIGMMEVFFGRQKAIKTSH